MLPSSLIVDAKVSHHKVFLNHPVTNMVIKHKSSSNVCTVTVVVVCEGIATNWPLAII